MPAFNSPKGLSFKEPGASLATAVCAALLGGALQTLSWPEPGWWPLCFVALCPLILAAHRQGGRRGFFLGWVYGLSLSLSALPWLAEVLSGYGGLGDVLGWGVFFLLCAFLALFQGLFGWIITMPGVSPFTLALLGSAAWCGVDWLKNWVLTGFNWTPLAGPLALSQMGQAADLIGFYGLGFFVALANFFLAFAFMKPKAEGENSRAAFGFGAALIIGALLGYGLHEYRFWYKTSVPDGKPQAAVAQPSTEQMHKWDADYRDKLFAQFKALNDEAAAMKPWFILWPETAMPFVLDYDYAETEWLRNLSLSSPVPILTGAAAVGEDHKLRNRMILLDKGEIRAYYDKTHLVPFGEYLPLSDLPFFQWPFVQGLIGAAGNFGAGEARPPIAMPYEGGREVKLGVMICFESIFPHIARQRVLEGAEILIVPTNDGWFGRSRAPAQHLLQASMRAIETRRPLLRAGNTGISASIYPTGDAFQKSGLYDVGVFSFDAPVLREDALITTFFVSRGYLLAPILAALTGLLALFRIFRK